MLRKLILVIIVLSFATAINAENYFASNASEIYSACSKATPGDTIIMKNGLWSNQTIVFFGEGTETDNIVLRAETPGQVVLSGTSVLRFKGKYLTVDGLRFYGGYAESGAVIEFRNGGSNAYHCRLTNTSIINYNPSNNSKDYKWVSIYGQYNRVDHCYFAGKTHSGTTLVVWVSKNTSPNYHRIDHNYFGERPALGYNGGETIRIGDSSNSIYNSSTTVEYNYFERCNGEIEIISNKSDNNIYRYNTFFECEGVLTLRHGDECEVYGNYFFGNNKPRTGGVRIIGTGHKVYNNYFQDLAGEIDDWRGAIVMMNGIENSPLNGYFQVDSAYVVNNTAVNCKNGIIVGLKKTTDSKQILPPKNSKFSNNVFYNCTNVVSYVTTPENFEYKENVYYNGNVNVQIDSGLTELDPLMEVSSDSLWRPTASSPLINASNVKYNFITDDIDGQPRDDIFDIGADEYSTSPVLRTYPTKETAGPNWVASDSLLMLNISTEGTGQVILDPAGGLYEKGTVVKLTAVPGTNSEFINWTGDTTSADNPISIVINKNTNITANFKDPNYYKIAVWKTGEGTVTFEPNQSKYLEGTTVIVKATPADGWEFISWGNSLTGNQNPDTLYMDADKFLTAKFEKITGVKSEEKADNIYYLAQNYPNPFNSYTNIEFNLPEASQVKILLFNSLGQVVDTILDKQLGKGYHSISYNISGKKLSSGRYFYKIIANKYTNTKCMFILK